MSFHDFMELALYHPQRGYYARGAPRAGRDGDFLTAPTASHWYATVLGALFGRIAERVGPTVLVDVAAGGGEFLSGVIERMAEVRPAAVIAVERSPDRRAALEQRLGRVGVRVTGSVDAMPPPGGTVVVHASELYDAAPVHRVVMRTGRLRELWVSGSREGLRWQDRPAPESLEVYLASHGVGLAEGQVAELNPRARHDHARLLRWAGATGLAIVLDYGYPAVRLWDPRGRAGGSLATYRDHRMTRDPLADPGERDLTAHVNWDDLRLAGGDLGWCEIGLWTLAELLVRAGLADEVERLGLGEEAPLDSRTLAQRQELKRLLDPEGMGADLKALVQAGPGLADLAAELLGC